MSAFLKNLTVKILGRRCLYVWGPAPPVTHCIKRYPCTYSHIEGGRGRRWTNEKVRGALVQKRGGKYQHTDCISSLCKLYKTPVKKTFKIWCLYRYFVHGWCCSAGTVPTPLWWRDRWLQNGKPTTNLQSCSRVSISQQFYNTWPLL